MNSRQDTLSLSAEKKELRALMRQRQAQFPSERAAAETEAFWTAVEGSEDFISAGTVLVYMAIQGEIPTERFIDKWLGRKRIAIPVVKGALLELREYSPDHLRPGYNGITEPSDNAPLILPSEIDFALIPGVAFAPAGTAGVRQFKRLGRGKGFYDRLLPLLRCPCIPAGFSFRFLDDIPAGEHDRMLKYSYICPNFTYNMVNEYYLSLGSKRSVIRELFEFGKQRRLELGDDKVFDFSLGNPSIPSPRCVREAVSDLLSEGDGTLVHCYSSSQGFPETRKAIADDANRRFGAGLRADDIYMTCGAAAGLSILVNALNEGSDEVVIFAPYFPEYDVFIRASGARPVAVPFRPEDFQIDFEAFERMVGPKTKLVIYNSPNNPSGVVYTKETLEKMCGILRAKEQEYGHPIYVMSDEPYREIVYGDVEVPYILNLYDNSVVCYSFSKSLSLPGERIGYLAVCPRMVNRDEVYLAICGAGRALGYVCAPSLFQKVVARVVGTEPDIEAYRRNRDTLYGGLQEIGYECVRPDGAFYLFVKALESDSNAFAEKARRYGLLLVPADTFCAPGYVRVAYCVSHDMIVRSMPAFKALREEYNK